ncbi:DUF262 domain-containing HNH endonuclease family protein [Bibersteinia trehalosi]|uniref:DUF262 domain-containing protein n=1 Tax=Bibersteinia trehalosi TaxID=47735 RepID=A0A426FGG2_BIBTR|nr:DUF262 domain-containing protein [Bibersteinia trehalosi]RRN02568.1 DUF262 domain-containing protein [Bibersteinia trehalosi]
MSKDEMRFSANHKTFSTILEPNYKYIIPRYQREYSWEKETHIQAFWDDLIEQIDITNESDYRTRDYFVGSVVLVGYEGKDTEFLVIDGQQRITTLTIFLSVLTHIGLKLSESKNNPDFKDFAEVCYRYIEGRDKKNKEFFKLVNETPKPFFQENIQYKEKQRQGIAKTDEEKRLKEAYEFFSKSIEEDLKKHPNRELEFLTVIRDQALRFSIINITVNNEIYAQKIFETLNTKGKDLETIDLIKNKVFDVLNKEHPDDKAKTKWNELKEILISREDDIALSKFFHHYWMSKYNSVAEHKIYSSFLKNVEQTENSYLEFLEDIISFAKLYVRVVSPQESDWKEQDKKDIFKSLMSLRSFKLTAHRTIIVTLICFYNKKLISLKILKELLYKMVLFHFIFIVTPFRSRIETTYAKYARLINLETDKRTISMVIKDFNNELKEKLGGVSIKEFETKFMELKYSNSFTQHKDIIKFIFELVELQIESNTKELKFDQVTLEHIEPQSKNAKWIDGIGNLLPLGGEINGKCDSKSFKDKISLYQKSNLKQVKSFCSKYSDKDVWTEDLAQGRANEMAKSIFDYIKSQFN